MRDEDFDRFLEELFRFMRRMQREMWRLTNEMYRGPVVYTDFSRIEIPAMDMRDEGDRYVIEIDLPGVDKKDIDIRLKGDKLVISARRREREEKRDEGYIRVERSYSEFRRVITLPEDADKNNIKARYINGVLIIEIFKISEDKSSRINVE